MMKPTIHMNGTSKHDLYSGFLLAHQALHEAMYAVQRTSPNGRDFHGPAAIRDAEREHQARLQRINDVLNELEELVVHTLPEE